MKKLTQWVLAATLTFCGAMMMLTSCTDAIGSMDNPVNPEQPVNPADELSKETFFHEDWMDRSVKPGDSFWNFCVGGWLKTRDAKDLGTTAELANAIKAKLDRNIGDYDSPVAGKLFKLLTQPAPEKSEEIKVLNLDPEKETIIRIFTTEGLLQSTYNVSGQETFTIKAANDHGFYLVELYSGEDKSTLRYIVK